jgi:polysaccharide biosynthesis/export protein
LVSQIGTVFTVVLQEGRMRLEKRLFIAVFLLALIPFPLMAAEKEAPAPASEAAFQATAEPDYRIGPGDQLSIEVWKDKDLARLVTVLPDGRVVYPMVGEVVAAGKTVAQFQKEIEGKLSLYVKDAVITVEVRQVNSLQIYVIGHVNTPGRSLMTSYIDVLQALAIAGGPDPFAKVSRIKIFRREGKKTVIIPFDYDDVIAGKNLESNILLRRGDVVVVP